MWRCWDLACVWALCRNLKLHNLNEHGCTPGNSGYSTYSHAPQIETLDVRLSALSIVSLWWFWMYFGSHILPSSQWSSGPAAESPAGVSMLYSILTGLRHWWESSPSGSDDWHHRELIIRWSSRYLPPDPVCHRRRRRRPFARSRGGLVLPCSCC